MFGFDSVEHLVKVLRTEELHLDADPQQRLAKLVERLAVVGLPPQLIPSFMLAQAVSVLPPLMVHIRCNQAGLIHRIPWHGPEVEA